jgi:hypothetical protein
LGQNKVAYRKSASYVVWKCLKSSWWVVVVVASYPLLSLAPTPVEVELGCDNKLFYQFQATHTVESQCIYLVLAKKKGCNEKIPPCQNQQQKYYP